MRILSKEMDLTFRKYYQEHCSDKELDEIKLVEFVDNDTIMYDFFHSANKPDIHNPHAQSDGKWMRGQT